MKRVQKTVLLWYSAPEMYHLVTDVPAYPSFLPWCAKAEVLAQDPSGMQARLHLAYAGVKHAFTTRNLHEADRQLTMTLVDGPFSMLDGVWKFTPVDAQACRIDFDLRYAFASPVLEAVVSPVFDRIAATFVDAFVKRAESVYGPR